MMREIKRTDEEIDEVIYSLLAITDAGETKRPGLTYEDGVAAALAWLIGEIDDNPMIE
jgi:hypothetical protein